jgi:hypothetical protein
MGLLSPDSVTQSLQDASALTNGQNDCKVLADEQSQCFRGEILLLPRLSFDKGLDRFHLSRRQLTWSSTAGFFRKSRGPLLFESLQPIRDTPGRIPKNASHLRTGKPGSCRYCITAERHVKSGLRFHYYRCTHKNKTVRCEDRSFIHEEKFAEEVKRNTALVSIPDEWKERFLARIETWEADASQAKQKQSDRLRSELASLKTKLDRINTAFADGAFDVGEFKELKNPLVPMKVELEQHLVALEKNTTNRLEPLKNWIFEANQAQELVSAGMLPEMKSFLKKVGSNRLLRAQTLTVSFTKPWNSLAETVVAVRDSSDVSATNSKWWRRRELNPRPKQNYQPRLHA